MSQRSPVSHVEPDGTVEATARLQRKSADVWNQCAELVGPDRVERGKDGKPVINLNGRAEILAFREIRTAYRRAAVEESMKQQAEAERNRLTVRNPRGERVRIEPELEGYVARKGFRAGITGRRRRVPRVEIEARAAESRPLRTAAEIAGLA